MRHSAESRLCTMRHSTELQLGAMPHSAESTHVRKNLGKIETKLVNLTLNKISLKRRRDSLEPVEPKRGRGPGGSSGGSSSSVDGGSGRNRGRSARNYVRGGGGRYRNWPPTRSAR
jgi:hypothetical protein